MAVTFSMTTNGTLLRDHLLLAQVFQETFTSLEGLKGKTVVIKLGGSTLEHQQAVLQDLIWLRRLGVYPVLVHGGGPYISEWLMRLNIPTRFEKGVRVTDAQTLEVVRMVLRGHINQHLVFMITQMGGKAIGLSGTDGSIVRAHIADERLGFVGEIDVVDPTPVRSVIETGYIPIIAPLGEGPDGTCLNINADLVAAHLAGALHAQKLLFLSDVAGIRCSSGSVLSEVTEAQARWLIEDGVITGGMIPKVHACLEALATVPCVHIVDGREPHVLLRGLFTDQGAGTMIVREVRGHSHRF